MGLLVGLALFAAALCVAAASPSAPVGADPSASVAASASPGVPVPSTAAPNPSAGAATSSSPDVPGPSTAAPDPLVASLLGAADLPSYLLPEGVEDPTSFDIDQESFAANGGSRAISQAWESEAGPVLAVVDFRMAFPTESDAAAYLEAAEPILSEASDTGLTLADEPAIADDARHYFGNVDSIGEGLRFDNFLFRVGSTVAKVFVATLGGSEDTPASIARAAVAQLGGEPPSTPLGSPEHTAAPSSTVSPSASVTAVAELLAHIPEFIAPACHSDVSPFGSGTALTCTTVDPVAVSYTLMDDMSEVQAAFAEAQASIGVEPIEASCAGGPFVGRYDVAGLGTGQILCATTGTEQVYIWYRDDLPILAFAVSDTFDFPALHAWWLGAGPNP
jgi:hypothetical protein